jgi:hypothetical protein
MGCYDSICKFCGKKFWNVHAAQRIVKYCGEQCRANAKVKNVLPKPDGVKICKICGETKPLTKFHYSKQQKDGFDYRCNDCKTKFKRKDYSKNRDIVFAAYGGYICKCCGETEPSFMTIDHINGGGHAHVKMIGGYGNLYAWLKRNNFPNGFQVLCFNCNHGKHLNDGICPHKLNKSR